MVFEEKITQIEHLFKRVIFNVSKGADMEKCKLISEV